MSFFSKTVLDDWLGMDPLDFNPQNLPEMPSSGSEEVLDAGDAARRRKKTSTNLTGGLMSAPTLGRGTLYGI